MTTSHDGTGWRPLLAGELRDRAAAWVETCANELADPDWRRFASAYDHLADPEVRSARAISLSGGCAGAALLFRRLGRDDEAHALLAHAIETLGNVTMDAGLLKGFAGVAWAAAHLGAADANDSLADDPLVEIDEALETVVADEQAARHDLGDGLAGIGLYFLERLPRTGAARALDGIVARLAALAVGGPTGEDASGDRLTWRVGARPQVNLGIAHGTAGVIVFLARVIAAADLAPEAARRARALLEPAVVWLIAQRWPDRSSRYPAAVDAALGPIEPRHGWCEGDLGVAIAMSIAGRALGRDDWSGEALVTARHAALRGAADGGVVEAGLCHGTSGVAHMLNRLAHSTGDAMCRAAAERWLAQTLELEHPGRGVAGVVVRRAGADGADAWHPSPGLLMGATGVALALEAAISDVAPTWDRALGLSG